MCNVEQKFYDVVAYLYQTDPADTCCKENEIEEEYLPFVEYLYPNITKTDLMNEFEAHFLQDLDEKIAEKIVEMLSIN